MVEVQFPAKVRQPTEQDAMRVVIPKRLRNKFRPDQPVLVTITDVKQGDQQTDLKQGGVTRAGKR